MTNIVNNHNPHFDNSNARINLSSPLVFGSLFNAHLYRRNENGTDFYKPYHKSGYDIYHDREMQRNYKSPNYTGDWNDLLEVK